MLRPLFFFICIFFSILCPAQITAHNFSRLDSLVIEYSDRKDLTPDSVIGFVNKTCISDSEKVRAYYKWISYNIDYDVDLMKVMDAGEETDSNKQNPDTVFYTKLGVCEGYAKLMKKFCEASNIPCEVIPGYSKASPDETVMNLYHAWNAVKINGSWQLVDVTWSNNYIDDEGGYMKEFTGKYFLNQPAEFVKDHLPLDPMWQLLEKPLTKNGFFENTGEHIPGYSYKDSLKLYTTGNLTSRHYVDMMHYHSFDPENIRFARSIDIIHNNIAAHYLLDATSSYLDYVDFFTTKFSETTAYKDCGKAKSMLTESKVNLTRTLDYLSDKTAFTEEFNKNFDEIRRTARSNLAMVNKSLEILGRFQKKMVVASSRK